MKLWRWLRSRPLARVRRTIATREAAKQVRYTRVEYRFSPELQALLDAPPIRLGSHEDISLEYAAHLWRDRGILSRDGLRQKLENLDRLIEEYPHEQRDE